MSTTHDSEWHIVHHFSDRKSGSCTYHNDNQTGLEQVWPVPATTCPVGCKANKFVALGKKSGSKEWKKEQTFIQAHTQSGNSLCSLPMMAVTALVTMAISVSPSMSAGSAPGFCSSCFWSHTHTNHVGVFLFSPNYRPAMFSVLCCCLHPPQVSVCCPSVSYV